jgi:hypothetical protein
MERHIDRKHGDYGVPVLTQSQHMGLHHQAYSREYSYHYFSHPRQDFNKDILEKKKADSFISTYKFEDKILGIYKKFLDALKLPSSEEKNLIVQDLMLQMKRAVSSSSYPMGQQLFRGMTASKFLTYPSGSDSPPTWWQEIGKLRESKNFNNSESTAKTASAVNANVSKDSHKRKLKIALQTILDYGKQRKQCDIP